MSVWSRTFLVLFLCCLSLAVVSPETVNVLGVFAALVTGVMFIICGQEDE